MAEDALIDYSDVDDEEPRRQDAGKSMLQGLVPWHPALLSSLANAGMEHPSCLQQRAIPLLVQRTNTICLAKAGVGKTSSYILAALQNLQPLGRWSVCKHHRFPESVKAQVWTMLLCSKRPERARQP